MSRTDSWTVVLWALAAINLANGVWMLVGSDDEITPPALTLAYAEALRSHGGAVDVTVTPGLPHNILLEPVTIDRLKDVVGANGTGR